MPNHNQLPPASLLRLALKLKPPGASRLKPVAALAKESAASCARSAALAASSGSKLPAHSSFCSQPSSPCAFGRTGLGLVGFREISPSARLWFFSTWESVHSGARAADNAVSFWLVRSHQSAKTPRFRSRPLPAQSEATRNRRPRHRVPIGIRQSAPAPTSSMLQSSYVSSTGLNQPSPQWSKPERAHQVVVDSIPPASPCS